MDTIFKTNMQKFITYEGVILIGSEALKDTMKDIIVDTLSAFFVSVLGYFYLIKKEKV